jgi:mono/diheme cytochrome c family protein
MATAPWRGTLAPGVTRTGKNVAAFMTRWTVTLLLALMLTGCEKKSESPVKPAGTGDANRGRAVYMSNCVACHNNDPARDGPIGPAIKGSSPALIEERLLRANYPPGYTPKRKTALMPAQPYLKSSVPDLAAFLR